MQVQNKTTFRFYTKIKTEKLISKLKEKKIIFFLKN